MIFSCFRIFLPNLMVILSFQLQAVQASDNFNLSRLELLITEEPLLVNLSSPSSSQKYTDMITSFCRSDSLLNAGDFSAAQQQYEQCLLLAERHHLPWIKALIFNRIGFMQYWKINFEESLLYYKRSYDIISQEEIIEDSLLVFECQFFIHRNNMNLGIYSNTVSKIIPDDIDLSQSLNGFRRVKYLLFRAWEETKKEDYLTLKKYLDSAWSEYDAQDISRPVWQFLLNHFYGYYYYYIKDNKHARLYYTELYKKYSSDNAYKPYAYEILFNLISYYAFNRDFTTGTNYLEEYLDIIKEKGIVFFYADFAYIAQYFSAKGDFAEAMKYYNMALSLLEENNVHDNRLVYLYIQISRMYRFQIKDGEAYVEYVMKALDVLKKDPNPYMQSNLMSILSEYYSDEGKFDEVIKLSSPLSEDLDRLIYDEEFFLHQYSFLTSSNYLFFIANRGLAYYSLWEKNPEDTNLLNKAHEDYSGLLVLFQRIYERREFQDSKINELKFVRQVYQRLFNICYSMYQLNPSDSLLSELFDISESSRAYITRRQLSDELAKKMGGVPNELIEQYRELRKQSDSIQYSIKSAVSNTKETEMSVLTLQKMLTREKQFNSQLEKDYPKYSQLRASQTISANIHDIQNKIASDRIAIEFYLTNTRLYTFIIDADTVFLTARLVGTDFSDQIFQYRDLVEELSSADINRTMIENYISSSHTLYKLIFGEIEDRIKGKRIVIIPDRSLAYIPFESLLTKLIDSEHYSGFQDLPYLILFNPISYLYSASLLDEAVSIEKSKIDFAGFSPSYSLAVSDENASSNGLKDLTGGKEEVEIAKEFFKGKLYIGEQATKSSFLRACLKSDIVHISGHAEINETETMNSRLLFNGNLEDDNQQLLAHEVYANELKSSLVVLSTCNSGVGELTLGEGVMSIARSFILAGADNVVYTLWSVTDLSSSRLMAKYYEYLATGLPSDVALQYAKTDMIKHGDPVRANPYFWAGYIQMGNPIVIKKKLNNVYLTGLLATIGILLIALLLLRKKKL